MDSFEYAIRLNEPWASPHTYAGYVRDWDGLGPHTLTFDTIWETEQFIAEYIAEDVSIVVVHIYQDFGLGI